MFTEVGVYTVYTGYIVISGLRAANGVHGFNILVQSSKLSSFVERRVESFLLKTQVHEKRELVISRVSVTCLQWLNCPTDCSSLHESGGF